VGNVIILCEGSDVVIKTVIFDLDNTLYSFDDANKIAYTKLLDYVERNLPIALDEFSRLYDYFKKSLPQNNSVCHNRLVRFQKILETHNLPLYPHALEMDSIYWETLVEAAVPSLGAVTTLEELKLRGIRIGIGTDMTARIQFVKLTKLGMLPYIDFIVSSEEACAEKPSPQFFATCVEKAGCEAGECIFVGDSLRKDVIGASSAGLNGVWYNPENKETKDDVTSIVELSQLLCMT
jgi:putative hydrolase of the HAD superfamily